MDKPNLINIFCTIAIILSFLVPFTLSQACSTVPNCKTCSTPTSCDECNPGYRKSDKGGGVFECKVCTASYCKKCDTSEPNCDECIQSFFLPGGTPGLCQPCGENCLTCPDSFNCGTCVDGYHPAPDPQYGDMVCTACSQHCSKCSTEGAGLCDANECKNPAYPRNAGTKKCEACATNCTSCTEPGKCSADQCQAGFYRNPTTELCEACNAQHCIDCKADKAVCVKCPDGMRLNPSTKTCEYCARHCKTCDTNGPKKCDVCNTECFLLFDFSVLNMATFCYGYYLNTATKLCEPCTAIDCKDCSTENVHGQCDVCADGFYRHPSTKLCYRCGVKYPGCLVCDETRCTTCNADTHNLNAGTGQCTAKPGPGCAENCAYCTMYGAGKCDVCESGYGLTATKTCAPCADNCGDCINSGPGKCDSGWCNEGYFSNGTQCGAMNVDHCFYSEAPTAPDNCMDCKLPYTNVGGKCVPCEDSNCLDCFNGPQQCTKCPTGYVLKPDLKCHPCPDYCEVCDVNGVCSRCGPVPSRKFFLHPLPTPGTVYLDGGICKSLCEGRADFTFYGNPPTEVCPYEAPYGMCAYGILYRFPCKRAPMLSAEWHFEYYRRGYTLTDTCEGSYKDFTPKVRPDLHFAFNNPTTPYFKELRDMNAGWLSETATTILSATPGTLPKNPPDDGSPLQIGIEIVIASIYDVDDIKMQYTMTFWLRIFYHNCKLGFEGFNRKYDFITLDNHDYLNFWMPDVYFRAERNTIKHVFSSPNLFMRLYKNGTMITSQKVTVTLACNMKLHRFPLDKQDCPMQLGSYTYPLTEVVFKWHERGAGPALTVHKSAKELPEFDLVHAEQRKCTTVDTFVGGYACLEVHLEFKRKFAFYFEQVYMPSALLVMLSWIGPWVDKSVTGSRVSIGLLTVLTVVTQAVGVNSRLPRVSYIKAVDIWMGVCLIQVVGGMLEFCIVNVIARSQAKKEEEEEEAEEKFKKSLQGRRKSEAIRMRMAFVKKRDKAHYIDLWARAVFPLFFLVFNILYWTYYLVVFTENPE